MYRIYHGYEIAKLNLNSFSHIFFLEKRADSDGSKDSSIDSGTEIRHYSEFRRETMLINKKV